MSLRSSDLRDELQVLSPSWELRTVCPIGWTWAAVMSGYDDRFHLFFLETDHDLTHYCRAQTRIHISGPPLLLLRCAHVAIEPRRITVVAKDSKEHFRWPSMHSRALDRQARRRDRPSVEHRGGMSNLQRTTTCQEGRSAAGQIPQPCPQEACATPVA